MTTKQLIALVLSGFIISTAGASDVISERESGFKGSKRAVATIKDALAEGNMATIATSARGFSCTIPDESTKSSWLSSCAGDLSCVSLAVPQHIATASLAVETAGQHEKQVGEAIQVDAHSFRYGLFRRQGNYHALGTAADGTRQMGQCRGAGAARKGQMP